MSTLHRVDSPVSSDQYSTPIAPVQPDTSFAAETQTHLVLRLQPAAPSERTTESQEVRGQALNPALAAALTPSSPRGETVPLVAQDEGAVDGDGLNAPRRDIQDFDNPDPEPGLGSRLWDVLYPVRRCHLYKCPWRVRQDFRGGVKSLCCSISYRRVHCERDAGRCR